MERKIGEIFKFGGEWYQCLKSASCGECAFLNSNCIDNPSIKCSVDDRNDNCSVIFKKLEKVGEPYEKRVSDGTFSTFQRYKVYNFVILPKKPYMYCNFIDSTIEIEIKQNKEDMEDLDKIKVRDYTKVEELNVMEEKKLNLKPFDIQKAREGKPVCTRDGRKARIICFDVKGSMYPIIALIEESEGEKLCSYMPNGRSYKNEKECIDDLMMLPEKKEGWVNVYKHFAYRTKEEAQSNINPDNELIDTIKIEWEE